MKRLACTFGVFLLLGSRLVAQGPAIPGRLSLDEAIRIADERSPAIAAARAAVRQAEAGVVTAGERPNPAVNVLSEGYSFTGTNRPSFFDNQEIVLRVEQEIEMSGRRDLRLSGARIGVDAARAALRDRQRHVDLEVRRAYFQVVLARADDEVARTSLDEIDQVIVLNRARFDQGEISGIELRRLQVERFRFADDRFTAELALKHARSALLSLLGVEALDQPFETTESLALSPAAAETVTGAAPAAALRAQALASRPDLQAIRLERDRARRDSRLQQALRTPNLTIGGGWRRDFGENGLVIDLTVPLPLFSKNKGGIARADADQGMADARVAAAERMVALDVQQALDSLTVSRARAGYIEREYLKAAREARDIVLASYREGAATLIDYLDAQRAYREALRTYNRALYDHRFSLFQLEAAVGAPVPAAQ